MVLGPPRVCVREIRLAGIRASRTLRPCACCPYLRCPGLLQVLESSHLDLRTVVQRPQDRTCRLYPWSALLSWSLNRYAAVLIPGDDIVKSVAHLAPLSRVCSRMAMGNTSSVAGQLYCCTLSKDRALAPHTLYSLRNFTSSSILLIPRSTVRPSFNGPPPSTRTTPTSRAAWVLRGTFSE